MRIAALEVRKTKRRHAGSQRPPLWVPGEGLAQPVGGELDVFAVAVCLEPLGRKKVATYYFCGFARLYAAAGPPSSLQGFPRLSETSRGRRRGRQFPVTISPVTISPLMGRPEPLSDDEILNYLHRSAKPASLRQIASALGLRHAARRALAKSVTRLKRRKLIEEARAGCYRIAGAKMAPDPERPRGHSASE